MQITEISKEEYYALTNALTAAMNNSVSTRDFYTETLSQCKPQDINRIKRYEYMIQATQEEFNRFNKLVNDIAVAYFKTTNKSE